MNAVSKLLIRLLRPVWFRGKGRLLEPLTGTATEAEARIFGAHFRLDLRDHIQRGVFLGTFEPHETRLVKQILRPGMTFVDAGANIGYFTALAAELVGPGGKVIASEPSPYAFERLRAMAERSGLRQVAAYPYALGDRPSRCLMTLPPEGNHTPSLLTKEGEKRVQVEIRALDDCMAEWGLARIDLLKLDVEGYELRVLQGAEKTLAAGLIGRLLIEFNDHWLREAGASPSELFEFVTRAGFQCLGSPPRFEPGCVVNLLFRKKPA